MNPGYALRVWAVAIEAQIDARMAEIEKTERIPGTNHVARAEGSCSADIKVHISPDGSRGATHSFSFSYPWKPGVKP